MTREISCKESRYSNVVLEELLGATGELTVVKDDRFSREEGGICGKKISLQNQHQHSGDPAAGNHKLDSSSSFLGRVCWMSSAGGRWCWWAAAACSSCSFSLPGGAPMQLLAGPGRSLSIRQPPPSTARPAVLSGRPWPARLHTC